MITPRRTSGPALANLTRKLFKDRLRAPVRNELYSLLDYYGLNVFPAVVLCAAVVQRRCGPQAAAEFVARIASDQLHVE